MSTPVWEDTPAVEHLEADCAVPLCGEFTFGHESPVMRAWTKQGEPVEVALQWCPGHATSFELFLASLWRDTSQNHQRLSKVERRYGYETAVSGLISA